MLTDETNPNMLTFETQDRFDDLPDSIVLHILSHLNTKEAFQTYILSKRWNNLKNNLTILTLDSAQFKSLDSFNIGLSQILSVLNELDEDDSNSLHTIDLSITPFDFVRDNLPSTDLLLKRMVRYALSHNVRRLRYPITSHVNPFPPLFSSQTLTSLDVSVPGCFLELDRLFLFPTHLNLPSLTDLTLSYFRFAAGNDGCADPFYAFNKLNTLTIIHCVVVNPRILDTFGGMYRDDNNRGLKLRISPHSLCNFAFTGNTSQKLCLSHLYSLKHLCIDAEQVCFRKSVLEEDSAVLLSSLQELPSIIRSLTVSSNTLQVLSLVPDLFKIKLTSLRNLESLEVQMKPISGQLFTILSFGKFMIPSGIELYQATIMPDGVVDYLIQNSPSANVTVIPYKVQDPREGKIKGPRCRKFHGKKHTKAKQI